MARMVLLCSYYGNDNDNGNDNGNDIAGTPAREGRYSGVGSYKIRERSFD
jgi:hypothetical protein